MEKKYKVGYAFCGGGSKGFAHLGALKAFDEMGIKPDIIAGTSAGAIAGVLYADGFTPDEIAEMFKGHSLRDFAKISLFAGGLLKPNGIATMLKENMRAHSFEELSIPFRAVATDWEHAEVKVFDEGSDLIEAVIASCTVPMVFQPQVINDVQYVDGGVVKNFPVSVIRDETECIIGVNLMKINPFTKPKSIKDSAFRYFDIVSKLNVIDDIKLTDILIDMDALNSYPLFDLKSIDEIMEYGYERTKEVFRDDKYKGKINALISSK